LPEDKPEALRLYNMAVKAGHKPSAENAAALKKQLKKGHISHGMCIFLG
jgi:hypothetical protein